MADATSAREPVDMFPERTIEPAQYAAFARRILRSLGRRCAEADPWQLTHLVALQADLHTATATAVAGLRADGYSWADIARPLGITRQGARQVYGPLIPTISTNRKSTP